jgi:hypothetical protein
VSAYELAEAGPIELAIYDLRGRPVPTDTYFCRLITPQGSQSRKLTLVRLSLPRTKG